MIAGVRALALPLDVGSDDSVEASFAAIQRTLGRIDILVNAAGATARHFMFDHPDVLWHRVLNVNSATPKHVVEKLVLCLRQAWHPDHGSPGERPLRTMKLQQINAAWDIVNGKRPAE